MGMSGTIGEHYSSMASADISNIQSPESQIDSSDEDYDTFAPMAGMANMGD
ncbi:hypothetical protein PC116_g31185 [Phytophthora cactorum]|nr:hypothetical protein PC116_g31185 [Phytophthora cactorum]